MDSHLISDLHTIDLPKIHALGGYAGRVSICNPGDSGLFKMCEEMESFGDLFLAILSGRSTWICGWHEESMNRPPKSAIS